MLHIFAGQGVKHENGYGYISRVPAEREKAKSVEVTFRFAKSWVPVSELSHAEIPEAELVALQVKHGLVKDEDNAD